MSSAVVADGPNSSVARFLIHDIFDSSYAGAQPPYRDTPHSVDVTILCIDGAAIVGLHTNVAPKA